MNLASSIQMKRYYTANIQRSRNLKKNCYLLLKITSLHVINVLNTYEIGIHIETWIQTQIENT